MVIDVITEWIVT